MFPYRFAVLLAGAALGACTGAMPDASDARSESDLEPSALLDERESAQLASLDPPHGGASTQPVVYADPGLKCYQFTSYQSPDRRSEKYAVPSRPDFYVGFNIKAPWTGTQYIRSMRVIADNTKVLHHLILFRNLNGGIESVIEDASGKHPDAEMLYGWSPGGTDLWFHEDVGMEVPGGSTFQVETHYNNLTGAPVPDGSGVEVCVTPTKPEHVAALSYVGEDRINGISATGHCTPESKQPVHLILGLPHMHKKGTHMKVDLARADGTVQSIHDLPFDFNYQRSYVLDGVVVNPGDKLTTTCTYAEPARFGKGTSDEMCFYFSVHWPAGALSRVSQFTALHGPNTCIDP